MMVLTSLAYPLLEVLVLGFPFRSLVLSPVPIHSAFPFKLSYFTPSLAQPGVNEGRSDEWRSSSLRDSRGVPSVDSERTDVVSLQDL